MLVLRSLLRYAAPAIQKNPSRSCRSAARARGFSAVEMKDHMRKYLLALISVVAHGLHRNLRPAAAPGHARGTGGLQPRRPAHCRKLIDQSDFESSPACSRTGRIYGGLRPGAEKPRAISDNGGLRRTPLLALVLAAYSPIWAILLAPNPLFLLWLTLGPRQIGVKNPIGQRGIVLRVSVGLEHMRG